MKFSMDEADVFIPDGKPVADAMARTTHLCIAAHQDDTEIFASHGIYECFGKKDLWFTSVIVTNGAGSPRSGIYGSYSDKEMQAVRREEQRKAAFVGEYSAQIQLAHPSSHAKNPKETRLRSDLVEILKACRPKTIYLHNPADKHETHVATLLRSVEAIRECSGIFSPEKVYGCEVWRDLDWLPDGDKVVLPLPHCRNLSSALLGVFDSQISGGKRYDLAAEGRRLANATFHESHGTDKYDSMTFAIDLMPLVENKSLSVSDFILAKIDDFKNDVAVKISKIY